MRGFATLQVLHLGRVYKEQQTRTQCGAVIHALLLSQTRLLLPCLMRSVGVYELSRRIWPLLVHVLFAHSSLPLPSSCPSTLQQSAAEHDPCRNMAGSASPCFSHGGAFCAANGNAHGVPSALLAGPGRELRPCPRQMQGSKAPWQLQRITMAWYAVCWSLDKDPSKQVTPFPTLRTTRATFYRLHITKTKQTKI